MLVFEMIEDSPFALEFHLREMIQTKAPKFLRHRFSTGSISFDGILSSWICIDSSDMVVLSPKTRFSVRKGTAAGEGVGALNTLHSGKGEVDKRHPTKGKGRARDS